jgi:hypothetical protein
VTVEHSDHRIVVDFAYDLQGFLNILNIHIEIVVRFCMGIGDVQDILIYGDETADLIAVGSATGNHILYDLRI